MKTLQSLSLLAFRALTLEDAKFPGGSQRWSQVIVNGGATNPRIIETGVLIFCDTGGPHSTGKMGPGGRLNGGPILP